MKGVWDSQKAQEMATGREVGFALYSFLVALIFLFIILGILVEYSSCFNKNRQLRPQNDKEMLNNKSKMGKFFLSFSFTRNFRKLMAP